MNKYLVVAGLLILILSGCTSPESQAAATATVIRAYSLATVDAENANAMRNAAVAQQTAAAGQQFATATGVALQAQATQTAVAIIANATRAANEHDATATAQAELFKVAATQTAVPLNAALVQTQANNLQLRDYGLTLAGAVGVFIVLIFALAISGWISTRGKTIPRDRATGMAQPVLIGNRVIDPAHQIGDVQYANKPGATWQVYRAWRFFKTGEYLPEPTPQAFGPGADATSQQLLSATLAESTVSATRAMFNGVKSPKEQKERIDAAKKLQPGNGAPQIPASVEPGESPTLKLIAGALASKLRDEGHDVSGIVDGEFSVDEGASK